MGKRRVGLTYLGHDLGSARSDEQVSSAALCDLEVRAEAGWEIESAAPCTLHRRGEGGDADTAGHHMVQDHLKGSLDL